MQIGVLKETHPGENRVALIPDTVKKLVKLGADITVEAGLGQGSGYADAEYTDAGATVGSNRKDMLVRSEKSALEQVRRLTGTPIEPIIGHLKADGRLAATS